MLVLRKIACFQFVVIAELKNCPGFRDEGFANMEKFRAETPLSAFQIAFRESARKFCQLWRQHDAVPLQECQRSSAQSPLSRGCWCLHWMQRLLWSTSVCWFQTTACESEISRSLSMHPCSKHSLIFSPTARATGGGNAFPIILQATVFRFPNVHVSGKP